MVLKNNYEKVSGFFVKNKEQLTQLLTMLTTTEKCRIGIVKTKSLQSQLTRRSAKDVLWLTPESLDYQLRFKTEKLLAFPEIWVLGTDIFQDTYRGKKLEFCLLRTKWYNPLVEINVVKIMDENWLYEKAFSKSFHTSLDTFTPIKNKIIFLAVNSHVDIVYWYHYLIERGETPLIICDFLPSRIVENKLNTCKKKGAFVLTTKDLAFKYTSDKDKLVILPPVCNVYRKRRGFTYSDMCLLLAFEKRLNNRRLITRLLTRYYSCTKQHINNIINNMISKGLLHELSFDVIVPTLLGKNVVRNFLSVETFQKVIGVKGSMLNDNQLSNLIRQLPEFSHEITYEDIIKKLDPSYDFVKNILDLKSTQKKIWLLKGILSILSALRDTESYKIVQETIINLQERKSFLLRGIKNSFISFKR
jgi:hypothetical protein